MKLSEALWQDDGRVSGAVCFRNTRVPVAILFEHLVEGELDEFYEGFPNVTSEQVRTVLWAAKRKIEDSFPGRRLWNEDQTVSTVTSS